MGLGQEVTVGEVSLHALEESSLVLVVVVYMPAGLGGLTVQAHCLSEYSHYPPPQPLAQLSPNQRVILWLALENGNGARARSYCWRGIPTCTLRSLVWCLLLSCICLSDNYGC